MAGWWPCFCKLPCVNCQDDKAPREIEVVIAGAGDADGTYIVQQQNPLTCQWDYENVDATGCEAQLIRLTFIPGADGVTPTNVDCKLFFGDDTSRVTWQKDYHPNKPNCVAWSDEELTKSSHAGGACASAAASATCHISAV